MTINELRQHRFLNMAIFDHVAVSIFAFVISILMWRNPLEMKQKEERGYLQFISLFVLMNIMLIGIGVIFHRLFGIQSALSGYLGLNDIPVR